jgi:hypothetical protein
MKIKLIACLALGLFAAVSLAQAADEASSSSPMVPRLYLERGDPLPVGVATNGISYVCGGIGEREQAAMKSLAPDYDLTLTFATTRGQYMADVDVQVADGSGRTVLDTRCDAPILLMDFPRGGDYQVRASSSGHEVTRQVRVPERGHRAAILRWPDLS